MAGRPSVSSETEAWAALAQKSTSLGDAVIECPWLAY
jgi:hypothetical protein